MVHFAGSLDLALVRVTATRGDDVIRQRVFPCLLSEAGYVTAMHGRRHGVMVSRAAHGGAGMAAVVLSVRPQHVCGANELCVDSTPVDGGGHVTAGAPLFVKIGRSRWALAGVNAAPSKASHTIALQPVFTAISWIEKTVEE